ncbi:hypothetical protein GE061_007397 [Apolygus lucorum]|uniref:Lipocalin/cytosolic fatty-acid binding domain-containing protein n=1 Tax=Apolygus lucorum TaxID=248454 RepID=A0A8S9WTC1_APOLU|nr:hypothetical protein GE061_007397 [Apolygus lucorum]
MKLIYVAAIFLFLRTVESLDASSKKFTKKDEAEMKAAVADSEAPPIDEFLDTGKSEKKASLRYEFIYKNKSKKLICEVEIRTKRKSGEITMYEWKCEADTGNVFKRRRKWRRRREKRSVW